ncbi:MAG: hypothetical protein PUB31_03455 [Bacteroidales bacterium]|nr:hypothetical protein [Bacteroidales bacterium]
MVILLPRHGNPIITDWRVFLSPVYSFQTWKKFPQKSDNTRVTQDIPK